MEKAGFRVWFANEPRPIFSPIAVEDCDWCRPWTAADEEEEERFRIAEEGRWYANDDEWFR